VSSTALAGSGMGISKCSFVRANEPLGSAASDVPAESATATNPRAIKALACAVPSSTSCSSCLPRSGFRMA
jgi:hypothetical protein